MEPTEILKAVAPEVERLLEKNKNRREWLPATLISPPFDTLSERHDYLRELSGRAAEIPPEIRAMVALILLTEEGLPYYYGLLAAHLGKDDPWAQWSHVWTAQEERHGAAIRGYTLLTDLIDLPALERILLNYLQAGGFRPEWESPCDLLAYTLLQENATKLFYEKVRDRVAEYDPVLKAVLTNIGLDEGYHYASYFKIMQKILEVDPTAALDSLWKAMSKFFMPGKTMEHYDDLEALGKRAGFFTALDLKEIVEDATKRLNIAGLSGLSAEGTRIQGHILKLPRVFRRRAADDATAPLRPVQFPFLHGSPVIMV